MKFHEFITSKVGSNWAVCRSTPRARAKYATTLTGKQYEKLGIDFAREYPDDIAAELFVLPGQVRECLQRAAAPAIREALSSAARKLYGRR